MTSNERLPNQEFGIHSVYELPQIKLAQVNILKRDAQSTPVAEG